MPIYAGIGSRKTPTEVCQLMTQLASKLESKGWILRSGNAPKRAEDQDNPGVGSADLAFQAGVSSPFMREIYLPWNEWNGLSEEDTGVYDSQLLLMWEKAVEMVYQYHPGAGKLSHFALSLLARNAFQILGRDLKTPANCVICWTKDGHMTGGTSHALRIAQAHGIPIRNLGKPDVLEECKKYLEG